MLMFLLEWVVLVLQCDVFVAIVLSGDPKQNQGRGLIDQKLVKIPK